MKKIDFKRVASIFTRKKSVHQGDATKTKISKHQIRQFLTKLSGAFFVVIAIMPFAGILLGVGASITGQIVNHNEIGWKIGNFINQIGGALFNNLPIFFTIAIVVVFTGEGISAVSAIWGYLIFLVTQASILAFVGVVNMPSDQNGSFDFLGLKIPDSILALNLGILSLSTSVFGGILVGVLVVWCYKKFKTIQLPSFLSFFSGNRFVPIILTFFSMGLSFIFMILWPFVGAGLSWLGANSGKLGPGVDSGIVAFIWRVLTPFGVHHAFYSLLWWTSAGGEIPAGSHFMLNGHRYAGPASDIQGDQHIWFWMYQNGVPFNAQLFDAANNKLTLDPGRFIGPNYPFMIGGYLGTVLAVIARAPKEHRKKISAMMISAYVSSVSIGVTEPMFWSYILIAPLLFFGFNSIMCGIGAAVAYGLGGHMGSAFSCGGLDWIFYGLIPDINGFGTKCYLVIILAAVFFPIYFAVFFYYMKWRKVQIPAIVGGQVQTTDVKQAKKQMRTIGIGSQLGEALGGAENILAASNCATRVRVDVKDTTVVNEQAIQELGCFKVLLVGKNYQLIFGPKAEIITVKLNQYLTEKREQQAEVEKKLNHASKEKDDPEISNNNKKLDSKE
ncbi:PTS transporter subunit EIIC [Mycoplasma sp. SG1]|uniref:PTS transporter subunit EIIC n=1 Tax=Mycoplasma sp. SG1 TaxID=2810348 RepID=UPI002025215C|nr:PTS transporter subunit EIIC [Mycoplasma sp. SG1]URM53209.1 PTS transporter subunit EIIC [Mycoplasma sp. SG1]